MWKLWASINISVCAFGKPECEHFDLPISFVWSWNRMRIHSSKNPSTGSRVFWKPGFLGPCLCILIVRSFLKKQAPVHLRNGRIEIRLLNHDESSELIRKIRASVFPVCICPTWKLIKSVTCSLSVFLFMRSDAITFSRGYCFWPLFDLSPCSFPCSDVRQLCWLLDQDKIHFYKDKVIFFSPYSPPNCYLFKNNNWLTLLHLCPISVNILRLSF